MKRVRSFLLPLVVGALCVTLLSCSEGDGGDDDGEGGGGSQNPTTSTSTTSMEVINRVLQILFGDEAVSQSQSRVNNAPAQRLMDTIVRQTEQASLTLSCSNGSVSFDGLVTVEDLGNSATFEITGTMVFSDCEGIDGTLALETSGTATSSEISLMIELNGQVSADSCLITFDQFSVDTTANATGTEITSDMIANGGLNGACDGDSVACTFDNVDVQDIEQFEASCV